MFEGDLRNHGRPEGSLRILTSHDISGTYRVCLDAVGVVSSGSGKRGLISLAQHLHRLLAPRHLLCVLLFLGLCAHNTSAKNREQ